MSKSTCCYFRFK